MRFFATTLFICGVVSSVPTTSVGAQTPTVPHKISFAGMTLTIRDDAREEIQKDVDMLTRSPKYFEVKAERARTYFPIIERIFAEERVPEDFKFLAIQESALIADAVSVSDAVGFWQFKDYTAREMGLRVDKEVDERMNIVSATRGAAKYIKQNNFMFNNWVYALQSYQMGAGGVRRAVGDDINGSRNMDITSETYWYVKKFIAHKIAFQDAVETDPKVKISEVVISQSGSFDALSSSLSLEAAGLREFNKWIRTDALPSDKSYTLIVPAGTVAADFNTFYTASNKPAVEPSKEVAKTEDEVLINEIPVLQAKQGETLAALATRAGLSLSHFMRYNDLDEGHKVTAGGYYFTLKKKSKTDQDFHKIKQGETLWQVSQLYGVQIKRLKKYNHLEDDQKLVAGDMLWLNSSKPRGEEVIETDEPAVELNEDKTFDWAAAIASSNEIVSIETPIQVGTHTVQTGETLYSISRQHGVAVNDLKSINNIGDNPDLKPGQVLKVTKDEEVTETPAFHEVKTSDTLYSVARQYGVTIKDLMECNNKKDFSVSVGERLKIPAK
ncbi:MAG: LysM peptidoglycan-binding domain-containing protein [Bacteroidota bacterium]